MSNQTSTSPRPNLAKDKMRQLHREGKWPPAGHPLRALALLGPREVEDFFRGKIWSALVEALKGFQDNAMHTAMNARPSDVRDEARGVYNMAGDMIQWADEIRAFHAAIREGEQDVANQKA